MAAKTATERQLEDLQAYLSESYLQDTANRRALESQGVPLPPKRQKSRSQSRSSSLSLLQPDIDFGGGNGGRQVGSDASNPFTGDEEGPATTDENGVTAVSAYDSGSGNSGAITEPEDDDLDALNAATEELTQATRARRAADTLKRTQPESDAAIRQATADKAQQVTGQAQGLSTQTQQNIRNRVLDMADRLGAVSTPGGIGALLLILVILLLILVPVNGQPRLVWLWLVLTRKASLMSEADAAKLSPGQPASEPGNNAIETNPAPTLSGLGVIAAQTATYAHSQSSGTPINVASSLLDGANSGLSRYINP